MVHFFTQEQLEAVHHELQMAVVEYETALRKLEEEEAQLKKDLFEAAEEERVTSVKKKLYA